MKIFICCSKAFYDKIEPIKKKLEEKGHSIVLPNCHDCPETEYKIMDRDVKEHAKWKGKMFKKSESQIKDIDAMLILNYEKNGIANYIGGATFLEMYDAFRHDKPIFMINPIPENMLKDELLGFNPIIINGDLGGIEKCQN